MIRKLAISFICVFLVTFNTYAGSEGELTLKNNKPEEIKDCFEKLNRATFSFNRLDSNNKTDCKKISKFT